MDKVKILIVEDDLNISESLADMLTLLGHKVVGIANSYNKGVKILDNEPMDLVLLDIQLIGEKSGIDLATTIKEKFKIPFIFTTAFCDSETIELASEESPYGYLIKPYSVNDINASITLALSNHQNIMKLVEKEGDLLFKDSLFIKTNSKLVRVAVDSILYIEAKGDFALFVTEDKGHIINSNFKNIEEKLHPEKFIRIHRSYIVNINKVVDIQENSVLINGKILPISRGQKSNLLKKLDMI